MEAGRRVSSSSYIKGGDKKQMFGLFGKLEMRGSGAKGDSLLSF